MKGERLVYVLDLLAVSTRPLTASEISDCLPWIDVQAMAGITATGSRLGVIKGTRIHCKANGAGKREWTITDEGRAYLADKKELIAA